MIETSLGSAKIGLGKSSLEDTDDGGPKLAAAPSRFTGRQPILEANLHLHGYEILYRATPPGAVPADPEDATPQAIEDYRLLMPEPDRSRGFVDCNREALLTGLITLLPSRNTILQIPRTLEPNLEVLSTCHALRRKGYRFALDDFSPTEARRPMLEIADYIKIDFQASDKEARREVYRMAAKSKAMLIAEKIATAADVEIARREGCKYFQGQFYSMPSIVSHPVIPNNQLICLRLMAALSEESANIATIETLVMMDTALCYRLLQLVNSVLYGLNSRVTSIRNALVIVGSDEFRKLVTVSLAGVFAASQSKVLVSQALERARFLEMLAPRLREEGPKLYLLGMLSLIDAILKVPMSKIIDSLPLDDDMKAALTGNPSKLGVALDLIQCYQVAEWDACDLLQQKLGLDEQATAKLYMDAVHWADVVIRQ